MLHFIESVIDKTRELSFKQVLEIMHSNSLKFPYVSNHD